VSKAIEAAMRQQEFSESDRVARGEEAAAEMQMSRAERIGTRWRVSDDALWNPFEVVSFMGLIVFGFGWFMGRDKFVFVAELFLPVLVVGIAVVIAQAVLRRKAGEAGVLKVLRERIR
jgi:hypothetical protein